MPVVKYSGIDWVAFVTDGLSVILVSLVLTYPTMWALQDWLIANGYADILTFEQVFLYVFGVLVFIWFVMIKSYRFWSRWLGWK